VGAIKNSHRNIVIFVLGVPFEEIEVAFFTDSFLWTFYEYTKSYRG